MKSEFLERIEIKKAPENPANNRKKENINKAPENPADKLKEEYIEEER